MEFTSKSSLLRYALFGVLIQCNTHANADFLVQHSAQLGADVEYNSNLQFLNQGAESTYIYRLLPTYKLAAVDDTNEIFGTLGFNFQKSSNSTISNDREDPTVQLGWLHQLESGELDFNAAYVKQSSRITQFTQTGVVAADGTSVNKDFSLSWLHNLTNRLSLEVLGTYTDSTFDGVFLGDFSERGVQTELKYQYSQKYSPYIRLRAADFRNLSRTKYQTALVGSEVTLSSNSAVNGALGVTHFSTDGDNQGVGFLEYEYSGFRSTVTLAISRTAFPTGLDFVEIGDVLDLSYGYDLTEKSKLEAIVGATQNKRQEIKTQTLGFAYVRELTPQLGMRVNMSFQNIKGDTVDSVHNDVLGITLTYNTQNF